ncbi:hypothetical protein ACFOU2_21870 [Bacillus songklensis]|uniref:Uncharacterized protein n=1 Tax=Bacillus songklensis TaxID=1069116 RepID=A0ABV8B6N6_9BACI
MTKQISDEECKLAVRQLERLTNKDKKSSYGKENNYIPKNNRPKMKIEYPSKNNRPEIKIEAPLKKKRPEMKIEYPPKR